MRMWHRHVVDEICPEFDQMDPSKTSTWNCLP